MNRCGIPQRMRPGGRRWSADRAVEAVEISRRLAQGPTVIKNERFTDLLPKPTTSKKVSPLHGIYAEQYHHCTPITRRKGRKSWGLGGRETLAVLLPQLPRPQEIKHPLKHDRLKLPTTFFTDKYGQVQIQTDIYTKKHLGKLLFILKKPLLKSSGLYIELIQRIR